MTDPSADLVERIREGDVQALADFIQLRRPQLLAYIERQLGGALRAKVEADDIFQDTSADAVRSLGGIDLGQRDPFAWLCQIAERRIIDAHRRYIGAQKRSAAREVPLGTPGGDTSRAAIIDMLVASMTTASEAFSRDARQMRIEEALNQMPPEQREALRLRYVSGLPSKQIAEQMGKSDGAVRVMLSRAVGRLQSILAATTDGAADLRGGSIASSEQD